jgi:hypothetical protein
MGCRWSRKPPETDVGIASIAGSVGRIDLPPPPQHRATRKLVTREETNVVTIHPERDTAELAVSRLRDASFGVTKASPLYIANCLAARLEPYD